MSSSADFSQKSPSGSLLSKQVISGGVSGMLADAVMYPMMTVKSRIQVCRLSPNSSLLNICTSISKALREKREESRRYLVLVSAVKSIC